jgi:Vacuolar protein sorting-associated protein 35
VDVLHASSPEVALRLNLQAAIAAAVTFSTVMHPPSKETDHPSETCSESAVGGRAEDLEQIQQHIYQNVSRAFEVFESGIVTGKSQFTALELIVGTLVKVGGSLEPGLREALAARTVKHSKRLLTRSDQCLALCQCVDLFWCRVAGSQLSRKPGRGMFYNRESVTAKAPAEGEDGLPARHVLDCVDSALSAARGCVNDGERVLLLLDIAHRLVRLHELGCTAASGDGRLDNVLLLTREILDERRAKNSIVGRTASTRLHRLCKHIRSHPNEYSVLALKNL